MDLSKKILNIWLENKQLDEKMRRELTSLTDEAEIYDRFYRELEFGTGGLRGVLGAGTNRMNIYTVRKATQGFADYINKHYADCPSVAIAYDSRINSDIFAMEAGKVLLANGIKVYLYSELMPTPALSFAVRYYNCVAGIMVTASHNPAKYNGYKVYNEEGCQMTLDAAAEVLSLIQKVDIFKDVKLVDEKPTPIPTEVCEKFLEAVLGESVGTNCDNVSLVYTPLNGAGNRPVREILKRIGVGKITIVEEQENPDGNFTTCPYPNPEKEEALHLGLLLCEKLDKDGNGPDLLLATDPDCDRVGVAIKNKKTDVTHGIEGSDHGAQNAYQLITGNEIGLLLLDFICQRRQDAVKGIGRAKPMPQNPITIRTIVSGKMADAVAEHYGVEMKTVLTGFKFIGEQIKILEEKGEESRYIFGFEESYGYLSGTYVRDKDAVNGAMLICQMVSFYKREGKTLADRLEELYQTYGYYQNGLIDFAFEGAAGMEKMAQIMEDFRKNPPKGIIGKNVVKSVDYMQPTDLPKADVLEYILEEGSSFMVRPSGTEPKLKIYLSAKGQTREASQQTIENIKLQLKERIHAI